jgi:hypothetical protein
MTEPVSIPHTIPKSVKPKAKGLSDAAMKGIAGALVKHVRDKTAPLIARIEALEKQAMEFRYRGVWSSGDTYQKGNFVSDHGSLWHANTQTTRRPGDSSDWTLVAKKGADAPDPRRASTIPRGGR